MSSVPPHVLAQGDTFAETGAYAVLGPNGARLGTVQRYYPAGWSQGAWLYRPMVNGEPVAEPRRSLADAARTVAIQADVIRRLHATGDHSRCLPSTCLAVRYADEHRRLRGGEQS